MNTRKYDSKTRKALKREQRGPAYRELQERTARERAALEAKLAAREKPLREAIHTAVAAIGGFADKAGPMQTVDGWPKEAFAGLQAARAQLIMATMPEAALTAD